MDRNKHFDDYDSYDDEREDREARKKKVTRKDRVKNSDSPRVRDRMETWEDDEER